jgi:hypothetical protein
MVSELVKKRKQKLIEAGTWQLSVSAPPLEFHAHFPSSISHKRSSHTTPMPRRQSTLVRSQKPGLENEKDEVGHVSSKVVVNEKGYGNKKLGTI